MSNQLPPPKASTTEARLRSFGLSSTSLEALSPDARAALASIAERAAGELCNAHYLDGPTGIAINLLGDETQLNAALAGPLREPAEHSGLLAQLQLLPLSKTLCTHTLASPEGYRDLADASDDVPTLRALLASLSGGGIASYAGVAVEVEGVRVGTICLYGTAPADSARRDAREGALRRYSALLSRQLSEAARLSAENAAMRAELRGENGSAFGDGGVYVDREHAAAWRETVAILGDVEHAVDAADEDSAGVAACVIELAARTNRLSIVAVSKQSGERFGLRPCVLRAVGDDDPGAFWRAALDLELDEHGAPCVFEDVALTRSSSPARLGTAPGAFASMMAAALPATEGGEPVVRGLVVFGVQPADAAATRAVQRALVGRFARVVADAQSAALGVFNARAAEAVPVLDVETPDAEVLARVRSEFGAMKLRALLTLAEERGVPDADDATGVEDLLQRLATHATRLGRARRAHLETLSIRQLLEIGSTGALPRVEDAETKREMIAAILEAEGHFVTDAVAPLPPLDVPPRHVPHLSAEQRVVAFDPRAEWLAAAQQRSHPSLPYTAPGAWEMGGLPRPPVPADEPLRNTVIERLGLDTLRDLTPDEFGTFDGVAAGAAAVAGAIFAAVTLVHADEQVAIGMTARGMFQPVLLGDLVANSRATTICPYGVAKGAALAVPDAMAEEAGPIGQAFAWDGAGLPRGYALPPRSYLGVPLVTTEGVVLGNVCVMDSKPRPDFADNARLVEQLEGLAAAVVNLFELRRLRRENASLNARRQLDVAAIAPLARPAGSVAPTERAALLYTDIEGSTELHERDRTLMKKALEVHDTILRRAIADNGGIEVTTEGDAFEVAFHSAADAIRCAFDAQLRLVSAPWPAGLENLGPSTATSQSGAFQGCRVRMTIHYAESGGGLLGRRRFDVTRHAMTRRPHYRGPFVDEARYVSDMASGGQIIVTQQAFDEVALALTTALGDPRVVDLGRYEAPALGDLGHVYELMPRSLRARTFAAPIRVPSGVRLTSPGFIHAPRTSPLVVMFVLPVGLSDVALQSDAAHARAHETFTGAVRACLSTHGGYEMKENEGAFMCAFPIERAASALAFGADVHGRVAAVVEGTFGCRVGINSGDVAIEPHSRTGRLEAYGPPCNRAARLAKSANPGQTLADAATVERVERREAIAAFDLGEHQFKGVEDSIHVVQIGDGFFQPIRSVGYQRAMLAFNHDVTGNITRSRAFLGAMDAAGTDTFELTPDCTLERPYVESILSRGLSAREEAMETIRLRPQPRD